MGIMEMKLVGDQVAITIHRSMGNWTKTRRIGKRDAFALSLLLLGEAQEQALNFEIDAGVSLQIENRPYDRAWLGIDDRFGGRTLVACLEGDLIRDVGQCLRGLSSTVREAAQAKGVTRSFRVAHCYLEQ